MTDKNTKISIIMPVKDTAKYLPACLDSILGQSILNWELIAVNDHSRDDSLEILSSYAQKDERIRLFNDAEPSLLPTLRHGFSKATGALIHRMDSDDIMPSDKLELMLDAWNKSGGNCVITGGTKHFSDSETVGDGFKRYDAWLCSVAQLNSHAEEMYRECVIPSNCWMVHRKDFIGVGGFNRDVFPEDYDLCFRFYKGGLKIVGLDSVLHYWRDRPDRISRNWECYRDNRFFELKTHYFFELERDRTKPLVLWGAGKNGKDLMKHLLKYEVPSNWVCDNKDKIGKDIYGIRMDSYTRIEQLDDPQIIIAVAAPKGQLEIKKLLNGLKLIPGKNYWFFS